MAELILASFGTAISVPQIVKHFHQLAEAFDAIQNASHDITHFQLHTHNSSELLDHVIKEAVKSAEPLDGRDLRKRVKLTRSVIKEFINVHNMVERLVVKTLGFSYPDPTSLADDSSSYASLEDDSQIKAPMTSWRRRRIHFKWFMHRKEVAATRALQDSTIQSAHLFCIVVLVEELREEIRQLKMEGRAIPAKLQQAHRDHSDAVERRKKQAKSAAQALEKFVVDYPHLIELEHVRSHHKAERRIERFADKVVPTTRRDRSPDEEENDEEEQKRERAGSNNRSFDHDDFWKKFWKDHPPKARREAWPPTRHPEATYEDSLGTSYSSGNVYTLYTDSDESSITRRSSLEAVVGLSSSESFDSGYSVQSAGQSHDSDTGDSNASSFDEKQTNREGPPGEKRSTEALVNTSAKMKSTYRMRSPGSRGSSGSRRSSENAELSKNGHRVAEALLDQEKWVAMPPFDNDDRLARQKRRGSPSWQRGKNEP